MEAPTDFVVQILENDASLSDQKDKAPTTRISALNHSEISPLR